ncbi:MAG TPA: hypothetical protein VFL81_02310 [Candidatus Saccharimonadales bacterium]|nr:hypothetical protein [Candidatus Saccharimonadales bacterium]
MSERLPPRYFDELARAIWHLGQISMDHIIKIAPIPSVVKGEIHDGDLCLEPEFELRHPAFEASMYLPRHIALTMSEKEPYAYDEDFTIYSFKRLELDTSRRRRAFNQGLVIMDEAGTVITPSLEVSTLSKRRRPGTKQWRELSQGSNLTSFGLLDANQMLESIVRVTQNVIETDADGETD